MQRKSFAVLECNIARSIEEVGDGWSLMIMRNALLGAKRFQDFEAQLSAPPNTLARRLQSLTERGFFVRRTYEARPLREEYELTEKLHVFNEWFAFFRCGSDDDRPQHYYNAGLAYLVTPNLQLDWRAGVGLSDAADGFFTGCGVSIRR